jgi:hypothetical protein
MVTRREVTFGVARVFPLTPEESLTIIFSISCEDYSDGSTPFWEIAGVCPAAYNRPNSG